MVWSHRMDPDVLRRVFPGESEIATRLRAIDWTSNELRTPDTWPQNLQSAIGICLASRVPMQVWWGPNRTLIYNDATLHLIATSSPGGIAQSGRELVSADTWTAIEPAIGRAFSTGETTWCERVRVLSGSHEHFVTFSFAPIMGEHGTVDGVFGAYVDVTESVVSERRLKLLHKLGIALASARSVEDATNVLDNVIRADSSELTFAVLYLVEGRQARAIAWLGTDEHTSGLPARADTGPFAQVIDSEDIVELQVRDGRAVAHPIRATEGVAGIVVFGLSPSRPFDDAYRAFVELVAAHISGVVLEPERPHVRAPATTPIRSNDMFLSIIAHELRNPLAALMTTLQTIMLRAPSPDVELMERSVRQLSHIVDNLLDVSRIARGRLELRPKRSELATIVDRAMELATPVFNERGNQVFVRVPRMGLRLDVDPDRIAQVIANVLMNASKYSSTGARIWVEASHEGERVRLSVKDEGSGIEPQRLAVVFETFYQSAELRPRTSGVGLGLAIARSLVEMHGGTIQLRSEGAGRGTECIIELPVEARMTATNNVAHVEKPRRRVLLIEDNDDAARALKNALEQLGYTVALAHDGPIALNVARAFDPDVVLMDIGLPVMDGWELACRLRALRDQAALPVVAVTARDQESDRQRSAEIGFAEHLVKPIDLRKLEQTIESLPLRAP